MEPKLILIEGLPGAGKTTVAKQTKKELEDKGNLVDYYDGKSINPADMAWQAYLTKEEYHQFVAECLTLWMDSEQSITDDELIRRIEEQSFNENGHVTIAYRNINFPDEGYWNLTKQLLDKEIYGGRVSFERFRVIHLQRWGKFAQDMQMKKKTVIFESSFLQNHIFEILNSYDISDEKILDYIMELAHTVMFLSPKILYVKTPNIGKLVSNNAKERANPVDFERDWFTQMEYWTRNTRYGIKNHLSGRKGIIRLLEERQRLDYMILDKVGIPVTWIARL